MKEGRGGEKNFDTLRSKLSKSFFHQLCGQSAEYLKKNLSNFKTFSFLGISYLTQSEYLKLASSFQEMDLEFQ